MTYLKNTWYVAARASEVTRQFLARQLLDQPVLFYRKLDGTAVAIEDTCPHRFAPLHMGRLIGDAVECGYHGLQFDCSGKCTKNPHGGKIPSNAKLRAYPLAELHGLIWIWMGDDPAKADKNLVPDLSCLESASLKTVGDQMHNLANYEVVVDNLMDLSHVNYLHVPYQKVDNFLEARHEVVQTGNVVESRRRVPSTFAPQSFRPFMKEPDAPVEYWLNIRWYPPAVCQLEVGIKPIGADDTQALTRIGTHIVTPETKLSSHYFYASSRNYNLNDKEADEETRNWQQVGFHEQDKPMLEAVQRRMKTDDLYSLNPILLASDAAAVRVRRVLASLIGAEQKAEGCKSGSGQLQAAAQI